MFILATAVLQPGTTNAQMFAGSLSASPTAFSPDANALNDVTSLRFTLADTAASLSLIVFAADSITPVDTLIAPGPDSTLGIRTVSWDGADRTGATVADGMFIASLTARPWGGSDTTITTRVFVDNTPAVVQVNGVSPAVYAPGLGGQPSVLSVAFRLTGVSPEAGGRTPDEIQTSIFQPSGTRVSDTDLAGRLSFVPTLPVSSPPSVTSDGDYLLLWDADGQLGITDGAYRIAISAVDAAGFTRSDTALAVLDVTAPSIHFDNVTSGDFVPVSPDSLTGFVVDAGGVDSLEFGYGSGAFAPLAPGAVSGDTTFFGVFIADSVGADSVYSFSLRATDSVGRISTGTVQFTLDTTAPAAPALDPAPSAWHNPLFPVSGTAPAESGIGGQVRIFLNGNVVDSAQTATSSAAFRINVTLPAGTSIITATYVDFAGNESAPAASIVVVFDSGAGLFVPAPFRPGSSFQFNATGATSGAGLRVYDLAGHLVVALQKNGPSSSYNFVWDGRNQNGILVNRGPLVAVAVPGESGSGTIRKVFLFDPGP